MSTRDTSGSAPQHSHPHNNTVSRNEKIRVDQVTVPQPPPPLGGGKTRGGKRHGGGGGEITTLPGLVVGGRAGVPSGHLLCGCDVACSGSKQMKKLAFHKFLDPLGSLYFTPAMF